MASTYSTDLKLELMATGENSGTWGTKTNTNLNLLQQSIVGYQLVTLTSINTTLVMTDATISNARNAVIEFDGTIAANTTVFVASGIEKTYTLKNSTAGAFTLALNQVGGASVIFGTTDKTTKLVYLNGTDVVDLGIVNLTAPQTLTNKTLTSPALTNATGSLSSPTITTPVIAQINDANGNEELKFTATASAVNEITITNAATGSRPDIAVTGGDTNIGLSITTKGTGLVLFNDGAYNAEATLTDGATITWDVGTSPVAKVTLGGNRTLSAPTNGATGQFISLAVIQDVTGSRTLTWNSLYEFTADTAPTLTTTASKADLFVFRYNGTVWYEMGKNLNLSIT